MFVDRAIITVQAGHGGAGHVSFRREKAEPKGGPDGGDGGDGGSVILQAEGGMSTLYDFRGNPFWSAQEGEAGGKKQCHGKNAPDLIIKLPPGTMVFNHKTGELMHDLRPEEQIVIARGGRGGFGNEHFKSAVNQTPRKATPGGEGERFELRFELKLIADVGFVGMPNAGKSTLLAALTRANPKIADYPFTTLSPQLGIAEVDPRRRIVLADIPGLIEGAAHGAGLGHDFLRHIERTKIIVHLLDAMPPDGSNPADNYRTIREELSAYSNALADKPEIVVLNKIDLLGGEEEQRAAVNDFCSALSLQPERDVLAISGAAKLGLRPLLERLWRELHPTDEPAAGWKSLASPER
ncbi:MAG: GTPase ObgE [Phycisphaerales bacterium]|nr:MAG: GTPase ObgE [Phycisphaerales bacterium]